MAFYRAVSDGCIGSIAVGIHRVKSQRFSARLKNA